MFNLTGEDLATHKGWNDFLHILSSLTVKEMLNALFFDGIKNKLKIPIKDLRDFMEVADRLRREQRIEHMDDFIAEVLGSSAYYAYLYAGMTYFKRIFKVDRQLLELASHMDPDKLRMEDVRLPLPITILYLQEPIQVLDMSISIVMMADTGEEQMAMEPAICSAYSVMDTIAGIWGTSARRDPLKRRIHVGFGRQRNNNLMFPGNFYLNIPFRKGTIHEARKDLPVTGMSKKDGEKMVQFFNTLVSYIALVSGGYIKTRDKTTQPRKKWRKGASTTFKTKEAYWAGEVPLVRMLQPPKTTVSTKTGTVVPHWRRGHLRSQPYGPERSQRKIIWIDKMPVNFDKEET